MTNLYPWGGVESGRLSGALGDGVGATKEDKSMLDTLEVSNGLAAESSTSEPHSEVTVDYGSEV